VIDRLVAFTDEHGIDAVAGASGRASPRAGSSGASYHLKSRARSYVARITGLSPLFQRGTEIALDYRRSS
jgi:hypothetical protein